MIEPQACSRLESVLARTGDVIVLSSSWRIRYDAPSFEVLIKPLCPSARVIGITPHGGFVTDAGLYVAQGRGDEIGMWLGEHPEVERFAIVDDNSDMGALKHRLVQTTWAHGLLDEHVELLVAMLNEGAT